MSAWLISSSLHTTLGVGAKAHQHALRGPLRPPAPVTIASAFGPQTIGRYALADAATPVEARLNAVIERNVASALRDSGLSARQIRDAALFVGTSSADMSVLEARYRRELLERDDAVPMPGSSLGEIAARVLERFGVRGPEFTFSTGCTSSANALLSASALLARGVARHAIVIGVELHNDVTALGFRGLQLLTDEVMQPFARERRGLAPGEACAVAVLGAQRERDERWQVLGGANMCDAFNMSSANPDGSTVAQVMRTALASTRCAPAQIAAVKVHGAASLRSDEAEAAGLRRVFDELPPLCALKPWIGHAFGACGLAELLLFTCALEADGLPATPGVCAEDSDLGVSLNQQRRAPAGSEFLLNYFGFGGSNTSLVLSRRA